MSHEDDAHQGWVCFSHGLAHLIAEHGYEAGLAKAGSVILSLVDEETGAGRATPPAGVASRTDHGRGPVGADRATSGSSG